MELKYIVEMIERERVVRNGMWKTRFTTNREGYRVVNNNGQRREVRMSYEEVRKRRIAAKKASRRMKGRMSTILAKRRRSLAKRG